MTTSTDTPQYERDLRSAQKEWKRTRDSTAKWAHGSRYLSGVKTNLFGDISNFRPVPECQIGKARPNKRPSQSDGYLAKNQNITKPRSAYSMPHTRRRVAAHVHSEMLNTPSLIPVDDALLSPLASPSIVAPSGESTTAATEDPFVYSFDRRESPGRPLTLEVFVRENGAGSGGKETEKLVEREYEVVDGNGEAVRGRRVRAVLRRAGGGRNSMGTGGDGVGDGDADADGVREDEGFELI